MKDFHFEIKSVILSTLRIILIRNNQFRIFYLVFILSFPFLLIAQISNLSHPSFQNFTSNDGLPSTQVYRVLQDKKGFLWFGTGNGLSRYNGYQFENFGKMQGLTDLQVYYLEEDRQGKIWMQSRSGRIFYCENDSIYAFLGNKLVGEFKNSIAQGFKIDSIGQIYSSIAPNGLFKFSVNGCFDQIISETRYASYQIENSSLEAFTSNQKDSSKRIIPEILRGQSKYNLTLFSENGTFYHNLPNPTGNDYFDQFPLKDHTLLVWFNDYFYCFKEANEMWKADMKEIINVIYENSEGEIFIGHNVGGGVRHYLKETDLPIGKFQRLLLNHSIISIIEDKDGGYWFAASHNGVLYCPNPKIEIYNQPSGLPTDYVTSIAIKNRNEIYIGFDNGGLINLDTRTQKITALQHDKSIIFDLVFDSKQNALWVATIGPVYLQNNRWHQLYKHNSSTSSIRANHTLTHFRFFPSHNELWGIYGKRFSKFDPETKITTFQSNEIIMDNLPYSIRTFDILTSSSKHTWIVNMNGLYELKNKQLFRPEKQNPVFYNRINAIEELPDSTLVLVSNDQGLIFWKGDSIALLTEMDGITPNSIKNMHVDYKGNLWIGSLHGLNKISWSWDRKYKLETMTMAQGLPSNEITDITSWNNDMWVGTSKGLAHFSNLELKHNTTSSKPIFASIDVDNHLYKSSVLSQLTYLENNLTIKYFAINYKMNGHIPYRYRINGTQWSQTFNTSLNFPSLPPGKRVLEVQAQNEDGIWSESAILFFVINPPWWNTWWARALIVILTIAFGYGIYVFRIRQLNQAHRIQIQMGELERSALQAQMNPHFIFNCLNSIQNYILQNEKEAAIRYLGSFASLVRSMLNASVVGRISLEEEIKLLNNYLDLEKIRFKNRFTYEVKIADGLDTFETMIPPLLVQPYVENAVKHGIAGKENGGKINVFFEKKDNFLVVSILDNGTGIITDHDNLDKQNNHKSFGMSITQNRLELLSNDNLNNTVRSKTLYDENNQISGTEVIIRIGLAEELHTK